MQIDFMILPDLWVDRYADMLYRYAFVRINDNGIAEDIVQETFLSAWRAKETFKGQTSEKNWLYAICKNKIIDYFRKKAGNISKPALAEEDNYFDEKEHWREEPAPKAWGDNYQHKIETKEFFSVFELCKKKLKDTQQIVFVMKYMEDMEADKICEVLNITPSNYWVLIHRSKLHLRSCLEKNWIKI